ncbi:MAG TPA: hypothetical protein VLK25_00980 [Allosphingosinicella sp.]|nr:hypothetical protein [Allosphingosinicella sp.]
MIGRALISLAALGSVLWPAVLQAQSGLSVNPTDAMRSAYSDRDTVEVIRHSVGCVVNRARGSAQLLLRTLPDTNDEHRLIYGPISARLDQCSWMGVEISNVLLRGAIAEILYKAAFSSPPPAESAARVPPLRWPDRHSTAATLAPIYELGRCVVADGPHQVHQLVATEPYSDAESAALRQLRPLLGPCLPEGMTFSTNPQTLRAVFAEALYHWALAQPRR